MRFVNFITLFSCIVLGSLPLAFSEEVQGATQNAPGVATLRSIDGDGVVKTSSLAFVWVVSDKAEPPCAKLDFEANGKTVSLCLKDRSTIYPPVGKQRAAVKFYYIIDLPEYPKQESTLASTEKNTSQETQANSNPPQHYRFDLMGGYASVSHENTFPNGGNTEALFQGNQLELFVSCVTLTPIAYGLHLEGELRVNTLGSLTNIILGSAYLEKNFIITGDKVFSIGLGGSAITMSGSDLYGVRNVGSYAFHFSFFPEDRHWSLSAGYSSLLQIAPSFTSAWWNLTTQYTLPFFQERFSLALDLNWIGLATAVAGGSVPVDYREHSYGLLLGFKLGE